MRARLPLLATLTLCAAGVITPLPIVAQSTLDAAEGIASDPSIRTRAETALLYAYTLDRVTRIIERDLRAETSLIVNGSFEDLGDATPTGYGYVALGSIPGWNAHLPAGRIEFHIDGKRGGAFQAEKGTFATNGIAVIDMGQSPGNLTMSQAVAGLTRGTDYTLTFDAGDVIDVPKNQMEVRWNGRLVDTVDPPRGTMTSYSYTVVSGDGNGTDTLTFREISDPADAHGVQLDNVRLIAGNAEASMLPLLRDGRLEALPSLDPELRELIMALGVEVRVMDVNPDPVMVDERVLVYVPEAELRGGVTRADIEAAARDARLRTVSRLQDGRVQDAEGYFDLPHGMSGLPDAAVASYVGIRGDDFETSTGAGTEEFRTRACPAGQFGSGIVERLGTDLVTSLDGDTDRSSSGWAETSRDCTPDLSERVRVFGTCRTASGETGMAVYEVTQWVRQDPADPFGTVIERDDSTMIRIDDGECLVGTRENQSRNYLLVGGAQARRELELRTNTQGAPIGTGVNTVPREVSVDGTSGRAVTRIPFPATRVSDFERTRTCGQEYGAVSLPASSVNPSGTGTGAWRGPSTFSGQVTRHRDYNRRETTFSDDTLAYILNYDVVLDPNPFGHARKGRDGNGWYLSSSICQRQLQRTERQDRTRACSIVAGNFPIGTYSDARTGTGTYIEARGSTPRLTSGPSWGSWSATQDNCYRRDDVRTRETRSVVITRGAEICDRDQYRVRIERTDTYRRGGSNTRVFFNPGWTNDGPVYNCRSPALPPTLTCFGTSCDSPSSGSSSRDRDRFIDVDGDGRGDFRTAGEARIALGNNVDTSNTAGSFSRSDDVQRQVDVRRAVNDAVRPSCRYFC